MLGFMPDAPGNRLYVDPDLPAWLPDLTVRDLHIGRHKLDIRFWRDGGETAFEVIKGDAQVVERCDVAAKMAALREGCGFSEWAEERTAQRGGRHERVENSNRAAVPQQADRRIVGARSFRGAVKRRARNP
jgi:hypothetical protein